MLAGIPQRDCPVDDRNRAVASAMVETNMVATPTTTKSVAVYPVI